MLFKVSSRSPSKSPKKVFVGKDASDSLIFDRKSRNIGKDSTKFNSDNQYSIDCLSPIFPIRKRAFQKV